MMLRDRKWKIIFLLITGLCIFIYIHLYEFEIKGASELIKNIEHKNIDQSHNDRGASKQTTQEIPTEESVATTTEGDPISTTEESVATTTVKSVPSVSQSESHNDRCAPLCRCKFKFTNSSVECLFTSGMNQIKSHFRNFPDHLCPQGFRNLADHIFWWNDRHHSESLYVPNFNEVKDCGKNGSIYYVNGWYLNNFFDEVYPQIVHPFILITGESDNSVPFLSHNLLN